MKVEIWSDIACPFCYIGKTKFQKALEQFDHRDEVEVNYRAFQIDPAAQKNTGLKMDQVLSKTHGLTVEKAHQLNQQVANEAIKVGLNYDFDKLIPTNSLDGLQLTYLAKETNQMGAMTERLMRAYLIEGLDIGDQATLVKLAVEVGLDKAAVLKTLQTNQYKAQIEHERQEAYQIGLQGVPFFIFNDKYSISGAQPIATFVEALNKVWQEEHPKKKLAEANSYCENGICHIN
ncbi:MAG: DsbA family oxidoreductase [Liquorilactobacillus satsumensis]|nr:DsbA family oxidoreductase [Liquorilactobacillus satsumensis]MCP9328700.1 DsbA family oxidoreductase [Liquorilactobacillus satsumensis]